MALNREPNSKAAENRPHDSTPIVSNDRPGTRGDERRESTSWTVVIVTSVVGLLTLYVLSPAAIRWAVYHGWGHPALFSVLMAIYWPLEELCSTFASVKAFYDWYFKLLGVD